MIINVKKAKEQLEDYTKNYNSKNERIITKVEHIKRVAELSKKIAQTLNLSEEEIELAELIGLLHDIGRFEQVKIYNTYNDKDSVNHGELGVKILFEDGLIRKFIKTNKYDKTIKNAILNHNRKHIEKNLSEKDYIQAQIIRDADKTDIFSILVSGDKKIAWGKEDLSNDKISDEIYRQYIEEDGIDYSQRKTAADLLVCHFKYVYDLNFKETKQIIKQKQYLDKLYKRFIFNDKKTMERYNKVYEVAKQYLEEKG